MSNQVIAKHHQTTNSASRLRNQFMLFSFAMLIVAQSIGCASPMRLGLGEAVAVGYRDAVWARRAYNLRYGNCNRQYADHFRSGFCAGYTEMANGGDGYTPALPPSDYRGYEFQTQDGAQCVNSWFEGYPAGVAAAKQDKAGTYHDVMISRMINSATKQENSKSVLPATVPVVSARQAAASSQGVKPNRPRMPRFNLPPIIKGNSSPAVVPASHSSPTGEPLPMAVSPEPWKPSQE